MLACLRHPVFLFCLLSLTFGLALAAINPPLRGPDESAHFLRIYSITQGEIIPAQADEGGRRGFMLAAQVYADFSFFEIARRDAGSSKTGLRELMANFADTRVRHSRDEAPVFQPYGGSEAYSPAPYLPYMAVGLLTRMLGFDFLATLYTMRVVGVVAFTAMAAYAIAMTPHLKWAFFLIAMLPGALYGRAVLSADGAALSATLAILALCLRAAQANKHTKPAERSLWMTLCLIVKPAQVAFVLLEGMTGKVTDHLRHWRAFALVILPGLLLTAWWLIVGSADVASWRMLEGTGLSSNEFNPAWKLRFMLENPLHFPLAALKSLDYSVELWRQLIGVLGWLDTNLVAFAYPLLSLLMLVTFAEALGVEQKLRARIAFWCGAAILGYTVAIFLIFFLIWTPTTSDRVLGIQGRYFLVVLPPLAVFIAAFLRRGIPLAIRKTCAIAGALLGGIATTEAIIRVNW